MLSPPARSSAWAVLLIWAVGCTSTASTQPDETGTDSSLSGSPQNHPGDRHGSSVDRHEGAAPPRRWVVTVGDSFISGEGARWAGNTKGEAGRVDAGGRSTYQHGNRGDHTASCHRVSWPERALGPRLRIENLACAGATTVSTGVGSAFIPGLDFRDGDVGEVGQLVALKRFAQRHLVTDVVVSIGGNDFRFAAVVTRCISAFVTTAGAQPSYCKDDVQVTRQFEVSSADHVARDIAKALRRVAEAMGRAGYRSSDYTVTVQNYPSPLPPGDELRYRETLLDRYVHGGCPVYDVDATWAHSTALPVINGAVSAGIEQSRLPNVSLLDLRAAFDGHRLCEDGASQVGPGGPKSWREPRAVQQLEWVNRLYLGIPPWRLQESLHPNHWGVTILRGCLLDAVQSAPTATAICSPSPMTSSGQPRLRLLP